MSRHMEAFSADGNQLQTSRNMKKTNDVTLILIIDKIAININMLGVLMKKADQSHLNCTGIIGMEWRWKSLSKVKFRRQSMQPKSLGASRRHSTRRHGGIKYLIFFISHFQEIKASPKYMHRLVIDRWISEHLTQSTSNRL